MDAQTGFSAWVTTERRRHNDRHAALAYGFMRPSAVPYPDHKFAALRPNPQRPLDAGVVREMARLRTGGLSRWSVAGKTGVSETTVSRYEERGFAPRAPLAQRLAEERAREASV